MKKRSVRIVGLIAAFILSLSIFAACGEDSVSVAKMVAYDRNNYEGSLTTVEKDATLTDYFSNLGKTPMFITNTDCFYVSNTNETSGATTYDLYSATKQVLLVSDFSSAPEAQNIVLGGEYFSLIKGVRTNNGGKQLYSLFDGKGEAIYADLLNKPTLTTLEGSMVKLSVGLYEQDAYYKVIITESNGSESSKYLKAGNSRAYLVNNLPDGLHGKIFERNELANRNMVDGALTGMPGYYVSTTQSGTFTSMTLYDEQLKEVATTMIPKDYQFIGTIGTKAIYVSSKQVPDTFSDYTASVDGVKMVVNYHIYDLKKGKDKVVDLDFVIYGKGQPIFEGKETKYFIAPVVKIDKNKVAITETVYTYVLDDKLNVVADVTEYADFSADGIVKLNDSRYFVEKVNGNFIVDGKFKTIKDISALRNIECDVDSGVIIGSINGKYGTVNANGDVKVPFEYSRIKSHGGMAIVTNKDGEEGILNLASGQFNAFDESVQIVEHMAEVYFKITTKYFEAGNENSKYQEIECVSYTGETLFSYDREFSTNDSINDKGIIKTDEGTKYIVQYVENELRFTDGSVTVNAFADRYAVIDVSKGYTLKSI